MKKASPIFRTVYIALIFVLLYFPVALMIGLSFNNANSSYEWGGFSFRKYIALFENEAIMEALMTTLVLGVVAAALATLLGTLACVGLLAMRKKTQNAITSVANIPLLNADIVTGVSLIDRKSVV